MMFKICPFRLPKEGVKPGIANQCLNDCAWSIGEEGRCAVAIIAISLIKEKK